MVREGAEPPHGPSPVRIIRHVGVKPEITPSFPGDAHAAGAEPEKSVPGAVRECMATSPSGNSPSPGAAAGSRTGFREAAHRRE